MNAYPLNAQQRQGLIMIAALRKLAEFRAMQRKMDRERITRDVLEMAGLWENIKNTGREKAMTPHEKYIRKCLDEAVFNAAHGDEPVCGSMTLTEILCFVLGWQGGTIHLVSKELGVPMEVILEADYPTMGWLCRLAQVVAHRLPDPLGEALNSGDGSYKP